MTKKVREQVVELLRCGADNARNRSLPVSSAIDALGIEPGSNVVTLAVDAIESTPRHWWILDRCLEAALRVEEGSWP